MRICPRTRQCYPVLKNTDNLKTSLGSARQVQYLLDACHDRVNRSNTFKVKRRKSILENLGTKV